MGGSLSVARRPSSPFKSVSRLSQNLLNTFLSNCFLVAGRPRAKPGWKMTLLKKSHFLIVFVKFSIFRYHHTHMGTKTSKRYSSLESLWNFSF